MGQAHVPEHIRRPLLLPRYSARTNGACPASANPLICGANRTIITRCTHKPRAPPSSCNKLLIICKYLDKHLEKSFIKANKSSATVSILLIYKLKKDIYVYIDYKGLNNIIVKNRYPILLIRETLNILYHTKIYIKFDIITTFNRLYIVSKNK